MTVHISRDLSRLEDGAFRTRLERLGIEVAPDGEIHAEASKVKGGDRAIATAAGANGVLEADEASQLKRNVGFVGQLIGRDATVSERATRRVQSLTLEVNGLAAGLRHADTLGDSTAKLMRRANNFETRLRRASESSGVGEADPRAVESLARAVKELAVAASALMGRLSKEYTAISAGEIRSSGGVLGALGAGFTAFAVAHCRVELEKSMNLLKPLFLLADDLARRASDRSPTERLVSDLAHDNLDEAGIKKIARVMEDVEARRGALSRHDLADALDRLLGRHFIGLNRPDAPGRIARDHADLLLSSKNPLILRALSGQQSEGLAVADVFAEILSLAARRGKNDAEAFMSAAGLLGFAT